MKMKHELTRRVGRFVIDKASLDACADWIQEIMARIIVVRADFHFEKDGIEYVAFCHDFKKVDIGQETPRYVVTIENGRFLGWSA